MKTLISRGAVVLAGLFAVTATGNPEGQVAELKREQEDQRLVRLKQFFQKHNCPAAQYAADFIAAADRHALDWRLLPSISFVESGGGKMSYNNNLFGWANGKVKFASVRSSVHTIAERLANSSMYRNKGVDEMLQIYNPGNAVEYSRRVRRVMRSIAPKAELYPALVSN